MIKAISFDFWFTLTQSSKKYDDNLLDYRLEQIYSLLTPLGFAEPREKFAQDFASISTVINSAREQQGNIDFSIETQLDMFLSLLTEMTSLGEILDQQPEMREQLLQAIRIPYTEASLIFLPEIAPDVQTAINWLKAQDYKIALISNTGRTPGSILRKVLDHYNLLSFFDVLIFSDEVGLSKPNPAIFQLICDQMNLQPHEIIHIGDGIPADVVGAREIGMYSALYIGSLSTNYTIERSFAMDFRAFHPPYILNDFEEIPFLIAAIDNNQAAYCSGNGENVLKKVFGTLEF